MYSHWHLKTVRGVYPSSTIFGIAC